jgi:hypothetical protein
MAQEYVWAHFLQMLLFRVRVSLRRDFAIIVIGVSRLVHREQ